MTFVSYAQNGEDVVLWRALGHVEHGFYVDVGAADPQTHSVTHAFYERGWSGINIEPLEEHFNALAAARPRDLNLPVVAAREPGLCTFHAIPGTGLSTTEPDIAVRHAQSGWQATPLTVPALPLSNILADRAPQAIHFLKIDVEGAEAAVLAGMDFARFRPWIILIESTAPLSTADTSAAWEPILLAANYDFAYFDGLNRFYVAAEQRTLIERLAIPPNVFDDFMKVEATRERDEAAQLRGEIGQLRTTLVQTEQNAAAAESRHKLAVDRAAIAEGRAESLRLKIQADLLRLHEVTTQQARALQLRDALLNSTAWQVTWPVRRLAAGLPPALRRHGRRALKAAWWMATPWHTARRLEKIRRRGRHAAQIPGIPAGQSDTHHANAESSLTPDPNALYERWIATYEARSECSPTPTASVLQPDAICISFLLTSADRPDAVALTLQSLRAQTHRNWEVLVPSTEPQTPRNAELSALLARAQGDWIAVLDPGDVLAPGALDEIHHVLAQRPDAAIVYSDEDELQPNGRRQAPFFKPGWSPELLQAFNYFGRLTLLSRTLAVQAGGFVAADGSAAEWGLNLRAADAAAAAGMRIERIAHVLCHRAPGSDRDRPAPSTQAAAQQREVLRAFWATRGLQATIETQPDGTQRSDWEIADPPLVSVIIPNHNSPKLLQRCLTGILEGTAYANVEIIIVENRSDDPETWQLYKTFERRGNVRVIRIDRSFNYSAACNHGAMVARGTLLLFLNNDIEVIEPSWLHELVRVVTLPGVGIAGTKLRYPDGKLQHAGVGVGIHLYGLMFWNADEAAWGVFGSPNHTRNWSAIMGACQMVRRNVFEQVGGFDESYQLANSDVALCLQAQRAGWRTAYTPFAVLVHHEGATRGRSNPPRDMMRSAREIQRLGIVEDLYLHPQLSGVDSAPRLRGPDEPSLREMLQINANRYIDAVPAPELPLDLFDNHDIQHACELLPDAFLWHPQPAHLILDRWTAARWVLNLIRSRTDLRRRFPRALADGAKGAFAVWIAGEGGQHLNLSQEARDHIAAAFANDLSARVTQLYFWREDLRTHFPLGLLPAGRRNLAVWLLRNFHEAKLRREEIWWFLLRCAEDPARELVRTYLFTPAWQQAHPYGLTLFGRDRFAAWMSNYYDLPEDAAWLNPTTWPLDLPAAQQIRLAYAAHADWRLAHPHPFATEQTARNFLSWLSGPQSNLPDEIRTWCAIRLTDGTPAQLAASGANIIGHFCYPSGLRVSVEAMANAIELAGGGVARRDMRTDPGDDPHHSEVAGLEPYDITIIHTQPEPFFDTTFARSDLSEREPRTYRIAYWYWELETAPADWGEKARAVEEIWVATNFVAEAVRSVAPVPVRTLFPGVAIGSFQPRSRRAFGLPAREDGRFAFLFSFHMGSVMERKNPHGLIRAFRRAFSPTDPVDLVLKTTSFGRFDAQVAELRAAAKGANITVLDRVLTPDETLSLMDACDAYVSLHRSEGLGLTMAEAMLLGKPVIATRYSGNLDFMDDQNSLLVDYKLVHTGPSVPPYDSTALWAEPSVEHAAQLMRRLHDNQDWARELGAKARADTQSRFSLATAGQRFMERLGEIKATRLGLVSASYIDKESFAGNADVDNLPV